MRSLKKIDNQNLKKKKLTENINENMRYII